MKTILFLLTCSLAAADITLATFNIRYAGGDKGKNAWENRKELVTATIKKIDPDILGLQEALHHQLTFLDKTLPQYARVGLGRTDGKKSGEFSPILYRKTQFTLLDQGTFWLSDTPTVPGSKTWDNVCERICTWAKLQPTDGSPPLTVYNTHWDHRGQNSRLKSADLILSHIKNNPVKTLILMGDFNATETNPALKKLTTAGLTNTFLSLHLDSKTRGTFHPWTGKSSPTGTIDHLFLKGPFTVKKSWIERHHQKDQWPSDHFPVATTITPSPAPETPRD